MISKVWLWCWEIINGTESRTKLPILFSLFPLFAVSSYIFLSRRTQKNKVAQLLPGPQGLPLIGNLPFLDRNLHSCFAKLAATYGPVIKVRLGSKLCIVFSSPSVAKEVLKHQDTNFANRDMLAVGLTFSYGCMGMGLAPYGNQWRMLRKLCVKELMIHPRLEALYGLRRREARRTVNQIYSSKIGSQVTISDQVFETMFNILTSMMWGSTLREKERISVTAEFQHVVHEILSLLVEANVSDFFPMLAWLDIQGKELRMKKIITWFDKVIRQVIDQRYKIETSETFQSKEKEDKDLLQILLQLIDQGEEKASFTITVNYIVRNGKKTKNFSVF